MTHCASAAKAATGAVRRLPNEEPQEPRQTEEERRHSPVELAETNDETRDDEGNRLGRDYQELPRLVDDDDMLELIDEFYEE
ncbi:unnamed protein product [Cylicocyclus nassatus]|uniref:Uncharacterized protein n=1 Tax=Cylicocyclus nassatus TaxID=53992 RepID=A0AA36MH17_CYLNA|nr:unnamed protein product [Cylicocyclus nassatus]